MRGAVLVLLTLIGLTLAGTLYEEIVREQIRRIPLDKAVVVGEGDRKLITVINPDCPHCRAEWRELRKHLDKLKVYVFVFPFKAWGEENLNKSYYIVCSKDKRKALDDVLLGKLDGKVPRVKRCPLLEEHLKVVEILGVTGVPYNIIPAKNKIIEGFSKNLLEELGIE
ncbi:MAG: thioredoxin fold domain-containing protein [Aquificota bacterium]|nr:thioredoxin fold domain-containing protein [Aquificota bacterium]